MELRQLQYFRSVAELKNFSRAAVQVRIAQPALSRQVRKLEDELGVALFYRDGRGAQLTEAGVEFYEHVCRALSCLETAQKRLGQFRGDAFPDLAIGASPSVGARFMSDVVMALRKEKPAARIRFIEGYSYQLADWLQSGRLDVALLYGAQSYAFVETRITVREQLFIVGRPGDVVVVPDTIPFCQLEGLRIISPDLPSTTRSRLEEIAEGVGIALSYDLRIDSIGTIKALAATGFGYAVLPRTAVADEISQVLLDLSRIVEPDVTLDLWLAISRRGEVGSDIYGPCDIIVDRIKASLQGGNWAGRIIASA